MKFTLDDQRSGRVGGVIPAFAQGGSAWGECVNDCLPVPEVQRLALQIFKAQLVHGFQLQAICSHTGSMCAKTSCPRHPSGPNTPIGCCRQLAVSLPLARRAVGTTLYRQCGGTRTTGCSPRPGHCPHDRPLAHGTLIVPFAAWARPGRRWVAGVTGLVRLGPPQSCLSLPGDCRSLFKSCELIALRLDGRALPLSGDVA